MADVEEPASKQEVPSLHETRAHVLARHQVEIKDLRMREIAMRTAAAKGSKAEQKAKKKQVEEEIFKLDAKMQAWHAEELALLEEDVKETLGLDGATKSLTGFSMSGGSQAKRPSRSQKRREKRAQQDAEREQRIQEEQSNLVSDRTRENEHLEGKLHRLGLTLKEIKPDGHCLYRAVEDQLALYPGICPQRSYQQLREIAASYMRSHAGDFIPFIGADSNDAEVGMCPKDSQEGRFENYCREVESTATWGGQLELGAIAHSLRKHIVVFSGELPEVEMGKEYESVAAENGEIRNPTLRLSYHRHAFGLGEHYNSVVRLMST